MNAGASMNAGSSMNAGASLGRSRQHRNSGDLSVNGDASAAAASRGTEGATLVPGLVAPKGSSLNPLGSWGKREGSVLGGGAAVLSREGAQALARAGAVAGASNQSKFRAAGAELMAEVYVTDSKAMFGGAEAVIEAAVDGIRKDIARTKARTGHERAEREELEAKEKARAIGEAKAAKQAAIDEKKKLEAIKQAEFDARIAAKRQALQSAK